MDKKMRKHIDSFSNRMLNESSQNGWYLIEKDGEYYAEKEVISPYSEIKQRILFRDFNGDIMSLGMDKKWAENWIQYKNEIDGYL